jgi:hypothetical protein
MLGAWLIAAKEARTWVRAGTCLKMEQVMDHSILEAGWVKQVGEFAHARHSDLAGRLSDPVTHHSTFCFCTDSPVTTCLNMLGAWLTAAKEARTWVPAGLTATCLKMEQVMDRSILEAYEMANRVDSINGKQRAQM